MIFAQKRNLFDALKIDRHDPDRYKKVADYFAEYDDRFQIKLHESELESEERMDERLLGNKDILTQLIEVNKTSFDGNYLQRGCFSFHYFKEYMDRIGVNDYTIQDWTNIAKVCFERENMERIWMDNYHHKRILASMLGHIDFESPEFLEVRPILIEYKAQYKKLRAQGKSINYIDTRDYLLDAVKNLESIPEELLNQIVLAYISANERSHYTGDLLYQAFKKYATEVNELLGYDVLEYIKDRHCRGLAYVPEKDCFLSPRYDKEEFELE